MLKMAGVKLEKISNIVMHLFIEKGLRGRISYIAKKCAKANKRLKKFVTCLDMNNFYGWAVSRYLPYGGFKWLKNIEEFDVNSISKKHPIGYILEVDLEYPDELHL